jgi:hypothetical protein
MFKIMTKMFFDLGKFLVIWGMILLTFACVSTLIFGSLESFQDLPMTILFYFEASIGNWDTSAYDKTDKNGKIDIVVKLMGTWFLVFFLIFNMVILLNFVIAILGNTFSEFNPQT